MKTLKLVLILILSASGAVVMAQDYAFKVLAHKGNNEVRSGGVWGPLKTGGTLHAGDEVRLGDNAYVGLVHATGKPVEVKQPGVYKVSDLEAKIPTGSSVLNKYTDFILSTNDEGGGNRLAATGAVTRTTTPAAPGVIKVYLPENTTVFDKSLLVRWEGKADSGPFVVKVMNLFEDILKEVETTETSCTVDLSDPKLANQEILIEVSSKDQSKVVSRKHYIRRMTKTDYDKVAAVVSSIKQNMEAESALNHVLMASFFEENDLLADAIAAYERAMKLEPEAYDDTYDDFMIRNNLK